MYADWSLLRPTDIPIELTSARYTQRSSSNPKASYMLIRSKLERATHCDAEGLSAYSAMVHFPQLFETNSSYRSRSFTQCRKYWSELNTLYMRDRNTRMPTMGSAEAVLKPIPHELHYYIYTLQHPHRRPLVPAVASAGSME